MRARYDDDDDTKASWWTRYARGHKPIQLKATKRKQQQQATAAWHSIKHTDTRGQRHTWVNCAHAMHMIPVLSLRIGDSTSVREVCLSLLARESQRQFWKYTNKQHQKKTKPKTKTTTTTTTASGGGGDGGGNDDDSDEDTDDASDRNLIRNHLSYSI